MARILVVDDEEDIQEFLRDTFQDLGHDVVVAENGQVAVDAYREAPADVVIMDLFMPKKEGLRAIVELQDDWPDVKVIAISGGGRMGKTDLLAMMKDFGVQYAFAKPFRMVDVIRAVNALITHKQEDVTLYPTLR